MDTSNKEEKLLGVPIEDIKRYASGGYVNNSLSLFQKTKLENFYSIKKLSVMIEMYHGQDNVIIGLRDVFNQLESGTKPEDVFIGKERITTDVLNKKYLKKLYQKQIEQKEKDDEERRRELGMQITPNIQFFVANYIQNVNALYDRQPFFFDNTNQFWIWDNEKHKYTEIDETDLMNCLDNAYSSAALTIDSSTKSKYLEAFRRIGRLNKPKELPKEWIQFKSKLFNINTKEIMEATPDNFLTNPLPWNIGETDATPTIDKLFNDWVGPQYVKTLYQIIAYCCYRDYPIHLCFTLVGSGRNGKSQFQRLLCKFLGDDNTSTTDLDIIIGNRFETIKCYKKLAVLMGETNFGVMEKTSMLKKLSGGDKIGFERKNKNPFDDYNYAKLLINSNSLPSSDDTSEGFYRRWLIVNFPNDFLEGKDIFLTIPDVEFENLAKKILILLPELIEKAAFENQGTVQERKDRYIEYSNPLGKFLEENYEVDVDGFVSYGSLYNIYTKYLLKKKMRVVNRKEFLEALNKEGYEARKCSKKFGNDWVSDRWIEGIKQKSVTFMTFVPKSETTPLHAYSEVGNGDKCHESHKPFVNSSTGNEGVQIKEENIFSNIHNEEVVEDDIIHHKCSSCGSTPCTKWSRTGDPLCGVCFDR